MDKVLSMIGMAKRAGKTDAGSFLCEKAIKSGAAKLVIMAEDISEASAKQIINACSHKKIKYITYADKDSLGTFTGGGDRAVVSINDESFARGILQKLDEQKRCITEGKDGEI